MKSRTVGGRSTGGRRSTSARAYSACSRALPPPGKNDCSVCAASWMTRSPSIRPGHPRSSARSRGGNMPSFTDRTLASGLGVDDYVRDVRALEPDLLLDLARTGVCLVDRRRSLEPKREEGHETGVGAQEAKLARLGPGRVPHDALDDRGTVSLD